MRVTRGNVRGAAILATAASAGAGWSGRAAAAEPPALEAPETGRPSAAPASNDDAASRHGSAFVDPLGFALFGPRLGVEAGTGHVSAALHARYFSAGLLARSLFLDEGDELGFSYGVGLRGRYYLAENLAGLHLGVAAEYLRTRIEDQANLLVTSSSYFVPYAEGGYRFAFAKSFYADLSAGIGYAFRLSGSVEDLPGGSSASLYEALDESSVYGTASLDLGIFF
jgi:hypothetical protein